MKLFPFSLSRFVGVFAAALSLAAMVSCHPDAAVSETEIAALQQRLDSINNAYQQLRSEGSEYAGQLSSKDSLIQAQTEEIQSLILQLRRARAAAAAPSNANADALREKNAQIAQMRSQLDLQSKQLKKLEVAAKQAEGNVSADLQAQIDGYKSQVSKQERQIADLNRQLSSLNSQVDERDHTIAALQSEKNTLSQDRKSVV